MDGFMEQGLDTPQGEGAGMGVLRGQGGCCQLLSPALGSLEPG